MKTSFILFALCFATMNTVRADEDSHVIIVITDHNPLYQGQDAVNPLYQLGF